MTVLDSSALIALMVQEPGAERVAEHLTDAVAPTTTLAEVVGYFARHEVAIDELRANLAAIELRFVAMDEDLAWRTGELEPRTRVAGLSLADRSCLALAARLQVKALTGDHTWAQIAGEAGVEVELIR